MNGNPDLRRLHSPDVYDLSTFRPTGDFGILVQAIVGPVDRPGEESFDFMLCTAGWFEKKLSSYPISGRHYLFVREYDYSALVDFWTKACQQAKSDTWEEAADLLSRIGKYEFEDYRD